MPDVPLYMENKAWERAERAYAATLQARDADLERKPMVVMAALIYAKREHLYQVDSLSMTLVSDQWIPLDGLHELPLVEELQRQGRAFLKPLRFDAKSGACFPNALLLDTEGGPFPLHVVSAFLDPKEQSAKEKAVQAAGDDAWVWRTDQALPALPPRAGSRTALAGSDAARAQRVSEVG
jgi:hypothetical protein